MDAITSRSGPQHSKANKSCAFYALIGITNSLTRYLLSLYVWEKHFFFTFSQGFTIKSAYKLIETLGPKSRRGLYSQWAPPLSYSIIWNDLLKVEQYLHKEVQKQNLVCSSSSTLTFRSCSRETESKNLSKGKRCHTYGSVGTSKTASQMD